MSEPDHVLACRSHIEKADGTGLGDDPVVQAGLAQAEAVLALAAAIDRLTGALSGTDRPKLAAVALLHTSPKYVGNTPAPIRRGQLKPTRHCSQVTKPAMT